MYRGFQAKQGLTTLVNKLTNKSKGKDFEVVFRGDGAATDITSKIILPRIADDAWVTVEEFNRLCAYIVHEFSHVLYTDETRVAKVYLHQLWNALEDGWIEGNTIASGDIPNAELLLTKLVNDHYKAAFDAGIDWADPRQWPFALAVWSRRYLHLRPPVPAPIAAIFDEAVARPVSVSLDNLETAEWVYAQIDKYLKKHSEPDEPREEPSDESGDGESGDDSDGESGEGDSGEPSGGESSGESGDDSDGGSDGESSGESDDGASGKGDIPAGYGEGLKAVSDPTAVEPTPDARIETVAERNKRIASEPDHLRNRDVPITHKVPTSWGDDTAPFCREGDSFKWKRIATPAKLRYELNRLFEGSAREQWNNGQRAGQINTGALARHSFDDGVFRRRQEEEGIDTALSIVIDVSGSTDTAPFRGSPTRAQAEFATVEAIYDALRTANVAIETYAYGNRTVRITNFGDGVNVFRANAEQAWRLGGWDNNDLEPLIIAHRSLLARPEKRKIVLFLTDGGIFAKREVFKQCVAGANLGITTIGVGVFCDLDGFFPQYVNISDLAALATTSFNQIKLAA